VALAGGAAADGEDVGDVGVEQAFAKNALPVAPKRSTRIDVAQPFGAAARRSGRPIRQA